MELDLFVLAPDPLEETVGTPTTDISGSKYPNLGIRGIDGEGPARQVRRIPVPRCDVAASDHHLANLTIGNRISSIVGQCDVAVRDSPASR